MTCVLDGVILDEDLRLHGVHDHGAALGAEGIEDQDEVTGPLGDKLNLPHCH